MIKRFTIVAFTAAFALTGCAKITAATSAAGSAAKSAADSVLIPAPPNTPDFSSGPTLVTVKHVATLADDGEPLYVTIDGTDAGILAMGQTVSLHVEAGKHKVGGYARSLIGRVTLSPVEVTTSTHADQHVQYAVTNTSPAFTVKPATPRVVVAPVVAPVAAPVVAPAPAATTAPATTTTTPATTTPATTTGATTPSTATSSSSTTTTTPATSTNSTTGSASSTTTTTPATTTTTTPSTSTSTSSTTTTPSTSTTTTTPSTDTVPTAPSL